MSVLPTPPPFATVVSGVPRSGTSLVMQMLAAGGLPPLCDGARAPDPDNPRGYYEYEPVKRTRRDASWVGRARGRAVKVVHALLPALPELPAAPGAAGYRVILVRRRLDEVLASQRAMLARAGRAADPRDDAALGARFAEQLRELLAWADARRDVALLALEHAALLSRPEAGARELRRFLGLPLDCAAMAAAVEPALHRQRAGASSTSCLAGASRATAMCARTRSASSSAEAPRNDS